MKMSLVCFVLFLCVGTSFAFLTKPTDISGSIVFLDVRSEAEFKAGHIKGAVHMHSDYIGAAVRSGTFVDIGQIVSAAGAGKGSRIVIYGSGTRDSLIRACALGQVLDMLGLSDVSILETGFSKVAESKLIPLDNAGAELKPVTKDFNVKIESPLKVSVASTMLLKGRTIALDVRSAEDFFGWNGSPGHISGAKLFPASFMVSGALPASKENVLSALSKLGINQKSAIILAPGTSEEVYAACFLMRRWFGYANTKIVNGGIEQWERKSLKRYSWQ